jgi:hypothetical protein
MKLEEYKEQLEKNELKSNIFIFKCKDKNSSGFLFHQYLNKYISSNDMSIENIEDISELYDNSLFSVSIDKNILYVYDTDKLDDIDIDKITSNLWIKCSKVSKKINDNIVIELPKLEEWHIKDYINFNLPSAGDNLKEKLFLNYKTNPFRLELEIEKIKCFDSYEDLEDQLFVDSTEYTVFDISNSLLRRDFNGLEKIKYNLNVIDVDPFGLLAILLKNFRYVIDIQLAKNSTPEYVGVSSKQFWAIKNYSCGHYTKDELVYIYKLLLSIDNKIKSGDIPINMVIDYIICKILLI